MSSLVTDGNLDHASSLLKAMGNRRRLHILGLLAVNERRVGELENLVGLSQSALSQHLARLRRDGLVSTRRQAQTIYYSLASDDVRQILAALDNIRVDEVSATPTSSVPPSSAPPPQTAMAR